MLLPVSAPTPALIPAFLDEWLSASFRCCWTDGKIVPPESRPAVLRVLVPSVCALTVHSPGPENTPSQALTEVWGPSCIGAGVSPTRSPG